MSSNRNPVLFIFLIFLSLSLLTLFFLLPKAEAQDNLVGDETCQECHDKIYEYYSRTIHKKVNGCEGCHGPGKEHVEGEGDTTKIYLFKEVQAQQASQVCLKCHRKMAKQNDYKRSTHGTGGLACNTCHQPHAPQNLPKLLKKQQIPLCYDCHKEIKAQFSLPERHRVPEGILQCTDCHNPHTRLKRALLASQNREKLCSKCHLNKTGPFIYEHPASFFEGCTACHEPHGSINRHMLVQQDVQLLCLSCHSGASLEIPSLHRDIKIISKQPCTNCHIAIHGSNSSGKFFR